MLLSSVFNSFVSILLTNPFGIMSKHNNYYNISLYQIFLFAGFLFLFSPSTAAQVDLSVDRASAVYDVQETIQFNVAANSSGSASYWIRNDRYATILQSGTIDLQNGNTTPILFQAKTPGVFLCTVQKNNQSFTVGTAVSPFEIDALEDEPEDFDAFWQSAKDELATVPIDPEITLEEDNQYTTTFKMSLATIWNRRVHGYISIPKSQGPFPAIISLPPYGSGAGLTGTANSIAERGGAISLSLSIHNVDPEDEDPNAYEPDVITNRDSLYYRLAILAGIRAIDYVFTRPDFDGESLGVNGVSQGGGLAMILAGIDQRVKLLVFSNSALCQHNGLKYDKASGFPYYLNKSKNISDDSPTHQVATNIATQYIDAVHFSKRYNGPALGITGYIDTICPSETVFAAFNQLRGPKTLIQVKDLGHSHPEEYWNGRLDFYRRYFPAMQTPPWPWPGTNQGYLANAGNDQTTSTNTIINLNGSVDDNNEVNTTWRVEWHLEEGPGNVLFSNPNSRTTSAEFNRPGNYRLRFTAFNEDNIDNNEPRLITITDYLTITVN